MTMYAFTGESRELSRKEKFFIEETIATQLDDGEMYITGAAKGVDILAARYAVTWNPKSKHLIIVPNASHDALGVRRLQNEFEQIKILKLHTVGTISDIYMARNWCLAKECDVMVAFPNTGREVLRSGTWATVRRAQQQNKEVRVYPLNGDTPRRWDRATWLPTL